MTGLSGPQLKLVIKTLKRENSFLLIRVAIVLHCYEWPARVALRFASLDEPSINVCIVWGSQELVIELCIHRVAMRPRNVLTRWTNQLWRIIWETRSEFARTSRP